MTPDDITRLAERVEALPVGFFQSAAQERDDIADELRALARTDHVEDKLWMVPAEANEWAFEDKKHMRGDYAAAAGWNACRAAQLATSPAPDHSAGAGEMVSSRHREPCWTCGGKAGESTQRKFMFACAECFRDAQPAGADAEGGK